MWKKTLNTLTSLVVIINLNIQDIDSLKKGADISITSLLRFSETKKSVVLIVSNFFLFIDKSFLKFDFFSNREVSGIVRIAIGSVLG